MGRTIVLLNFKDPVTLDTKSQNHCGCGEVQKHEKIRKS